jgi:type I restriction-modification system DNA methylase subunit
MSKPSKHTCARCLQTFSNKGALDRHAARKKPCEPVADQVEEAREKALAAEPSTLKAAVWQARNILRRAGVTGMEAADCITVVIVLRELEKAYPTIADAATFGGVATSILVPLGARDLVKDGRQCFSRLSAAVFDDGEPRDWAADVRSAVEVLKFHADVKRAVQPLLADFHKMYPLRDSRASYDLVRHVRDRIVFDGAADTLGGTYQSIVKDFLDGKELGQFFTPPPVVEYATRAVAAGRELGHVFDPTCGSGSFLAAARRHGATAVSGIEIDTRVLIIAYANVLLSGASPGTLRQGDFLVAHLPGYGAPWGQFDTVLANPPFGVKGVKHEEIVRACEDKDVYPLKTSATGFFLERIVRVLAVGGRGAVVLPLGKELGGRAPADVKFRRALLRAVAVREIVIVPAGAFENTGIRTAIIVFDKVRELGTCLTRHGKSRVVISLAEGVPDATRDVALLRLRTDVGGTVLPEIEPIPGAQARISIEEMEEKGWSLSPDDYRIEVAQGQSGAIEVRGAFPMARLGDLCRLKVGKTLTKASLREGPYLVVGGGASPMGSHLEKNTDGGEVLISRVGAAGWVSKYETPVFVTDNAFVVQWTTPGRVFPSYGWHYLKLVCQAQMLTLRKGAVQPVLDVPKVMDLEVPLPPLEIQRAIAEELDAQARQVAAFEAARDAAEHQKRVVLDNCLYERGHLGACLGARAPSEGARMARLGDLCQMRAGGYNSKDKGTAGNYPFFTASARNPVGFGDVASFDFPEYIIFVKDGGNARDNTGDVGMGRAWHMTSPSCGSTAALALHGLPPHVCARYLASYLDLTAENTRALAARFSTGIGHISMARLSALEVPLPPIEIQRAVAEKLKMWAQVSSRAVGAALAARANMAETLMSVLRGGALPERGPVAISITRAAVPDEGAEENRVEHVAGAKGDEPETDLFEDLGLV